MHYSRFCSQVQDLLKAELPAAADVELSESDGTVCVTVRTPADVLYPSVPLPGFFNAYLQGLSLGEIIRRILSVYTAETLHPFCTASDFTDRREFVKGLGTRPACLRLHRRNLPLLPHAVFHDMLFFFTAQLPGSGRSHETSIVTKEISSHFRMTDDALLKTAAAASEERSPAVLYPLSVYLDKLTREYPDAGRRMPGLSAVSSGSSFFVLTNDRSHFGAGVLLYRGMTEQLFQRFGPYYLLPSSVHEILILPREGTVNQSELKHLIRSANRDLCDSLLVLSDDLYNYDPENGLMIC